MAARGPNGNCCVAGAGEEATACGVSCGGGGKGAMNYVGGGQGDYIVETTYRYVGCGGDYDTVRPQRNFACLITTGCLLSVLLLIPLILWLCTSTPSTTAQFDCSMASTEMQMNYCCATSGMAFAYCTPATAASTVPPPPTPPPTTPAPPPPIIAPMPPPTSPPPTLPPTPPINVITTTPCPTAPPDPNCAVGQWASWTAHKQHWCCQNHHICSGEATSPPPPADPYNCADGFSNWQAGWAAGKKAWCCTNHGKGCPGQPLPHYDCNEGLATWQHGWTSDKKQWCCTNEGKGCEQKPGGCVTQGTTQAPYDCNAGFANWVAGWSIPKKHWCCTNSGKGCTPNQGGCV